MNNSTPNPSPALPARPLKAILICPSPRPAIPELSRRGPLALLPFLGKTVLERTLVFLAAQGAKEIRLLAADRPDDIRAVVGRGETWGLKLEVLPLPSEPTVAQARAQFHSGPDSDWLPAPFDVMTLDRLPPLPEQPLWESYPAWFETLAGFMPRAAADVGVREVQPGVFVGLRSQVHKDARLVAPCWIGANVRIDDRAVIGPRAIVEESAYVDEGAEISASVIGPQTYVGVLTEVRDSFAWGRQLLNLQNGSRLEVPDSFLLRELAPEPASDRQSLGARLRGALSSAPRFLRKLGGG